MSFLTKTSLKSLLIGGFLVCAFLTGLSGGIGIFSLWHIKTMMSQIAGNVIQNVDKQNAQIQRLIPARKIITQISEATTPEDLDQTMEEFRSLHNKSESTVSEIEAINQEIIALAEYKKHQISALQNLNQLKKENISTLDTITKLTIDSVKASEKESNKEIENEILSIKNGFGRVLSNQKTSSRGAGLEKALSDTGINSMMDELIMVSEMSISAVRAAMSVQSRTNRQLVVVNDIIGSADMPSLEEASKEIHRLGGEINSELVELPEDRTTDEIISLLQAISSSIEKMVEAKKSEIATLRAFKDKELNVRLLIGDVENRLLSEGKKLTHEVENRMNHSGDNVNRWQFIQVVLVVFAIVLALFIGFMVSAFITTPINNTIAAFKDIAQGDGDLTFRLDDSAKNEMGRMGRWFNVFIQKLQGIIKEIARQVDNLSVLSADLSDISEEIKQGIQSVSEKSNNVSISAEEMSTSMSSAAITMDKSATNTNMVASSSEEISSTIDGIARNVEKAREISNTAVQKASETSTNMDLLGNAAVSVGNIIETITEISEQVNLLALNATIESARAGEAGKGFAVVANEIKELARQTQEATQDIKDKIKGIQETTTITVEQISEIINVIIEVNNLVATISTSVEKQSESTRGIAASVAQASRGIQAVNENVNQSSSMVNEITRDIADVSNSLNQMSASGAQVFKSSGELSALSENLRKVVQQFKC